MGTGFDAVALYAASASWIAWIGSYSPVKVVPRIATTPIVSSSTRAITSSASIMKRSGVIGM